MTEQDHQHRPPKREFERHSGTGRPIKGENKRQGGGAANWGSEQEVVQQGVDEFNSQQQNPDTADKQNKNPANQAELNEIEKPAEQKTSYEDFVKSNLQAAYNTKTVQSQFKKSVRLNKSERETDLLFAGDQKDKKKRNKKKKTKQVLETSFTFQDLQNSRGRGGGGFRGRGGFNNQNTGDFSNRGNFRGGFGSRGRGRVNENFDNNNNASFNNDNQNNNQNDLQNFSQPTNTAPKYQKKKPSQTTDNNVNQATQQQQPTGQQSSNQ